MNNAFSVGHHFFPKPGALPQATMDLPFQGVDSQAVTQIRKLPKVELTVRPESKNKERLWTMKMICKPTFVVLAALLLAPLAALYAADVTNLRCEYLNNPLGIDVARPRLSGVSLSRVVVSRSVFKIA